MNIPKTVTSHRRRLKTLVVGASAIVLLGLGACSHQTATQPEKPSAASTSATDSGGSANATEPWVKIVQHSTQIYGLAKAENWEKANLRLNQLKQANTRLKQDSSFAKQDNTSLDAGIQSLEQAVNAKNVQTSMQAANELVSKTLDLTKQVKPSPLADVMVLGYQARKLEMAAIAQNADEANASAKAIQQTWAAKKPELQAGASSKEAQQVDQVVEQLKATQSAEDYKQLAPDLIKAEKALEKSLSSSEKS
ncbi:MAG TPA: hypothetical protein V6C57_21560 [Coleofasciculaceae cyanobacterium]